MEYLEDQTICFSASEIIADLNAPQFAETGGGIFYGCQSHFERKLIERAFTSFGITINDFMSNEATFYYYTDLTNEKYNQILDIQRPQ